MATPPKDSRFWAQLTQRAAAEPPPAVDVRFAVRRQIEAERATRAALGDDDFAAALLALVRLPWMRAVLGAMCAVTLLASTLGWRAAESLSEPLLYAAASEPARLPADIP